VVKVFIDVYAAVAVHAAYQLADLFFLRVLIERDIAFW
jgi:hypothetical protein